MLMVNAYPWFCIFIPRYTNLLKFRGLTSFLAVNQPFFFKMISTYSLPFFDKAKPLRSARRLIFVDRCQIISPYHSG